MFSCFYRIRVDLFGLAKFELIKQPYAHCRRNMAIATTGAKCKSDYHQQMRWTL